MYSAKFQLLQSKNIKNLTCAKFFPIQLALNGTLPGFITFLKMIDRKNFKSLSQTRLKLGTIYSIITSEMKKIQEGKI